MCRELLTNCFRGWRHVVGARGQSSPKGSVARRVYFLPDGIVVVEIECLDQRPERQALDDERSEYDEKRGEHDQVAEWEGRAGSGGSPRRDARR